MVISSNVFFQCALLSVHAVDVKINLIKKRGGKRVKKELLMERNAPSCELDATRDV